jgi:hypothetical protein
LIRLTVQPIPPEINQPLFFPFVFFVPRSYVTTPFALKIPFFSRENYQNAVAT